MVARYSVSASSSTAGTNVTCVPLDETVPATLPPPLATSSVTLASFSVFGSIASENSAEIVASQATSVASSLGSVLTTVGAVVSPGGKGVGSGSGGTPPLPQAPRM